MKKILFLAGFCLLIFYACFVDTSLPNVNGMWQLKTVQSGDGCVQTIDSVYYSFQRQTIFAYTLLFKDNDNIDKAHVLYGYAYFPEEGKMNIQLDKIYSEYQFDRLPWINMDVHFDIVKLNSKEMILFSESERKTYNFIKF